MRTWIAPILLCMVISVQAQHTVIDSLKTELDQNPSRDTLRADLLNEISWWYIRNDIAKGIAAAEESVQISEKLNDKKRLSTALSRKAANLNAMGRDSLALSYYDRVLSIRKNDGDSVNLAKALFNIGLVYYNRSDYSSSTARYRRALAIFEKAGDSLLMARMYNSIAINYMLQGAHREALHQYLLAARIHEQQGDTAQNAYIEILSNIGLVYHHLDDLDASFDYQTRALAGFERLGNMEPIANALTNLGNIHQDRGNYTKALNQYSRARKIMHETGNNQGVASALTNMGDTYLLQNNVHQAIKTLQKALPMYEKLGNTHNLAQAHRSLGLSYDALYGKDKAARDSKTAETHFLQAASLAETSGSLEVEEAALTNLADHYATLKNYKKALTTFKKADILKDSLTTLSRKDEIARLEERYASAKREDALRLEQGDQRIRAEAEIQRQKDIKEGVIIGLLTLLVTASLTIFFYSRKKSAEAKQERAEHEALLAEYKYKAICAQLKPHFMLNAMNALSAYIVRNQKDEALEYLGNFGNLLRRILANSDQKLVPLEKDLKMMRNYLKLEKERMKGQLTFEINFEDALDIEETKIPPAILQPFIENSIWHGPGNLGKQVHIKIDFAKEGDYLLCSVDDNGVGRNGNGKTKTHARKSVGIPIAQGRVETINKLQGLEGTVHFIDKQEGLRVEVQLPFENAF